MGEVVCLLSFKTKSHKIKHSEMMRPPELEHLTANAMFILIIITIFQKKQRCQVII